jgi:hypothetical protein
MQRQKIYNYDGGLYRVNSTFLKRRDIHYYWCYNIVTKEFTVLHRDIVSFTGSNRLLQNTL